MVEERCDTCGGSGQRQESKKLKITIPAGVDNGTRLRVSGEGDTGQKGGTAGDLYVYLFVEEDAHFRRDGVNILSDLKITYLQAILGPRLRWKRWMVRLTSKFLPVLSRIRCSL